MAGPGPSSSMVDEFLSHPMQPSQARWVPPSPTVATFDSVWQQQQQGRHVPGGPVPVEGGLPTGIAQSLQVWGFLGGVSM